MSGADQVLTSRTGVGLPVVADAVWQSVTIAVPAFNEECAVGEAVRSLRERYPGAEILVVDDGSRDMTGIAAAAEGVRVIAHPTNIGYGSALKTALRLSGRPLFVTFDGDGQHDPAAVERLVAALGDADMVSGVRHGPSSWSPSNRIHGRLLIRQLAEMLLGVDIPDLNCGLRVFRRTVLLRYVHLTSNGFSFSATSLCAFLRAGRPVQWIPVDTYERKGVSSVHLLTDGPRLLIHLLRLSILFSPLRLFLPVAVVCLTLGAGVLGYSLAIGEGVTDGATLLSSLGVLFLGFGLMLDQIVLIRRERNE